MTSPRRTLFQHLEFLYDELDGATVERLLADVDENGAPAVVLLKPEGHHWQWFFLDAGLNFWCEYDCEVIEELLADGRCVDYGERLGLTGSRIGIVRGEEGPRIRVAIADGELILEAASLRFAR